MNERVAPAGFETQAAYDTYMAATYNPVFFNILKQASYSPRNETEARPALALGAGLYADYQREEATSLAKQGSIFERAASLYAGHQAPQSGSLDAFAKRATATILSDADTVAAAGVLVEAYEAY